MKLAERDAERRQVLAGVADIHSMDALVMAESYLKDKNLQGEAAAAVTIIGQAVYQTNLKPVRAALQQVLAADVPEFVTNKAGEIVKEIDRIKH